MPNPIFQMWLNEEKNEVRVNKVPNIERLWIFFIGNLSNETSSREKAFVQYKKFKLPIHSTKLLIFSHTFLAKLSTFFFKKICFSGTSKNWLLHVGSICFYSVYSKTILNTYEFFSCFNWILHTIVITQNSLENILFS